MRLIGRAILALFLLLVAYQLYLRFDRWPGWQKPQGASDELVFDSYRVYWLDDNLAFKLPANTEQVRVMLTSTVHPEGSDFSLGFSVIAQDSQILTQGTRQYHHPLPPPEGQRFLETPAGKPAHYTREFYIDGNSDNPLSLLKLQRLQGDNVDIAVRVAVLERKKDSELAIHWQRMHRDRRVKLLEGHIYPSDLVAEDHRRAALKFQWLPIGPEGLEGQAYRTTTLFVKNEDETTLASGIGGFSGPDTVSEFKVVTFEQNALNPIVSASCAQPQQWMELAWVDGERIDSKTYDGAQLPVPAEMKLYRIRSSAECQLSLFDGSGQTVELERLVQRAYVVTPDKALTFELTPQTEVQPLKLAVRGLNITESEQVQWQIESESGSVLLQGHLQLTPKQDMYERLALNDGEPGAKTDIGVNTQMSAKTELTINAPSNAARLRVQSQHQTLLVKLFSRGIDMPWLDDSPKWFTVEPDGFESLQLADLSKLIYWQRRLAPADGLNILSRWQSLAPQSDIANFELFTQEPSSNDSLSTYWPLVTDTVTIEGIPGRRLANPSLIYQTMESVPQQVTVHLNGEVTPYWLTGTVGKLNLRAIKPGVAKLSIHSDSQVKWFLNHQLTGKGALDSYRLRQVYPLSRSLGFLLEKSEPQEWVSLHYYPATNAAHRLTVTINYVPRAGVSEGHTIPVRQFSIAAQQGEGQNVLLNQGGKRLWGPIALGFALEQDLNAASYSITVKSDLKDSGYIQASYVKQASKLLIEHFSERGDDDN